MTSLLLFVFNTLVAVYYAKKRWYLASIMFVLSSVVLFGMSVFMVNVPYVTQGVIGIIGVYNYLAIQETLLTYTVYAFSPYLAIVVLAVVSTIVLTVNTAARVIEFIRGEGAHRERCTARTAWHVHKPHYSKTRKTYLSFCSMLC